MGEPCVPVTTGGVGFRIVPSGPDSLLPQPLLGNSLDIDYKRITKFTINNEFISKLVSERDNTARIFTLTFTNICDSEVIGRLEIILAAVGVNLIYTDYFGNGWNGLIINRPVLTNDGDDWYSVTIVFKGKPV